ncbi:MAG: FHA domain-containing protein [Planctomycetota bacterium]
MDIENAQYDTSFAAEIEGTAGLFRGERTYCRLGQSVVVGRSRACDLSVARSDACLQLGREALDQHPSYRKISRRHIRITLLDADHLEVEDLSTNGTAVDGYRVDKRVLSDFRSRREGLRIEFGEGEILIVKPARGVPGPADELAANASGSHAGGLLD